MIDLTQPVMYGLNTLDLILAGCMCVLAVVNVTTPVKCKHPCANCARERAEAAERQRKLQDEYAHQNGLDGGICDTCHTFHCHHEPCRRSPK
jgi:hypothetical protein